jgi:glycosyltransferase involved in cell wall biosynthesis
MRPKVSVVIPAYNHAEYVREAVVSALYQTLAPHEVIVVDDGSTDSTPAVLAKLAAQHPEVIVWRRPNRGAHDAINAGIHRSTGELVSILNSDDVYEPARLETLSALFRDDPELLCACSGVSWVDDAGRPFANGWYEEGVRFRSAAEDVGVALVHANTVVTTSNMVVRRSAFEALGWFAGLRYAHDLDFLLRVARRPGALRIVEQPLVRYRWHASNTLKEAPLRVRAECVLVICDHLAQLSAGGGERSLIPYLEPLRWQGLLEPVLLFLPHFTREPSVSLPPARYDAFMTGIVSMLDASAPGEQPPVGV